MRQSFVVVPIIGTTGPEQLRDALDAARVSLTPEQ